MLKHTFLARSLVLALAALALSSCRTTGGSGAGSSPTWSIQYQGKIKVRPKTYTVVDLFDCSSADLAALRGVGSKPIAYFSSQYENWRSDSTKFPAADLGKPLGDWAGERWVNPNSPAVRAIMLSRLDLAKARGFHGVDVDNTDFFEHTTGFDNSLSTAAAFVRFIATEARKRGLKYSLKNSAALIPKVKGVVDFYQNEEAQQYGETDLYRGVSPVFNIEYKRPSNPYQRKGFYSLLKKSEMGAWEEEL